MGSANGSTPPASASSAQDADSHPAAENIPATSHDSACTDVKAALVHHIPERIRTASGLVSRNTVHRISEDYPFFAELGADKRSLIGSIIQSAVQNFADWLETGSVTTPTASAQFREKPLTIVEGLSLQDSVAIVHTTMEVVEQTCQEMDLAPDLKCALYTELLRYNREIGFSVAEMYAEAAEQRGVWDLQMETALVNAIIRGSSSETIESFGSALNWDFSLPVSVVVGSPREDPLKKNPIPHIHNLAARTGHATLAAPHGTVIVLITTTTHDELLDDNCPLYQAFDPTQPIMVNPPVPTLVAAHNAALEAFSALRVSQAMPGLSRVTSSEMFLPERTIAGDPLAVKRLFNDIIIPLRQSAGQSIQDTLRLYLSVDGGVEECARQLAVHPNTVRYRLKRVTDITGMDPLDSRMRFTLRIANVLGMLEGIDELPANSW